MSIFVFYFMRVMILNGDDTFVTPVGNCPECKSSNTRRDGFVCICDDCGNTW